MRRTDDTIERQQVPYVDERTSVDIVKTDWNEDVRDIGGELMIPLASVEQILVENEELREALFTPYSETYNRAISEMRASCGHSTSNVLKIVRQIEMTSKNALTGKDVFNFMYSILANQYGVNFKDCPAHESKLQWLWKEGWLPIVSHLASSYLQVVQKFARACPREYKSLADAITNQMNQKHKVRARFNKGSNPHGSGVPF